ncbi:MAG: TetR/AcrR family transcriptional regulator [Mycobacteriales bacterium]|nr:TetR/AcrR family transcriptional regulator [Mycobacteriales bacterium]
MPAVKSRREENVDATRDALLASALELFAGKGFAATSLDDVATAARVTKGALYHHFPGGKATLFEAVFEAVDADLGERIARAIPTGATAWEVVHRGLDAYLETCTDPVVRRIVFQEGPAVLGTARWREGCHSRDLLRASLEGLVASGDLRPQPMALLTQVLWSALGEAGIAVAEAEDPAAAQAEVRALVLDLLRGLSTT